MSASGTQDFRLGFLTAVEDAERGYVGGLLVTNRFGRPLEFQCTAPVKPNKTQQILYGPTLRPYVLAELIGRTLVEKASVKPSLIITESADLLDLRIHVACPVASLANAKSSLDSSLPSLRLGEQTIVFAADRADDRDSVQAQAKQIPSDADLKEPFDRVREALQETLRTTMSRAG